MKTAALKIVKYLEARFEETSTKLAITTAIISAAALSVPWSYILFVASVVLAIVPTSGKSDDA